MIYSVDNKKNFKNFRQNMIQNLFNQLLTIPNVEDIKQSTLTLANGSNTLILQKNQLLIDCFGLIGPYNQGELQNEQNQNQEKLTQINEQMFRQEIQNFLQNQIFNNTQLKLYGIMHCYSKFKQQSQKTGQQTNKRKINEDINNNLDFNNNKNEFKISMFLIKLLHERQEVDKRIQFLMSCCVELFSNYNFSQQFCPGILHLFLSTCKQDKDFQDFKQQFKDIIERGIKLHQQIFANSFYLLSKKYKENKHQSTKSKMISQCDDQQFQHNFKQLKKVINKEKLAEIFINIGEKKIGIVLLEKLYKKNINFQYKSQDQESEFQIQLKEKKIQNARILEKLHNNYKQINEDFKSVDLNNALVKQKLIESSNIFGTNPQNNTKNQKNQTKNLYKEIYENQSDFESSYFDIGKIEFMLVNIPSIVVQLQNTYRNYQSSFSYFIQSQVLVNLEILFTLIQFMVQNKIKSDTAPETYNQIKYNLSLENLSLDPNSQFYILNLQQYKYDDAKEKPQMRLQQRSGSKQKANRDNILQNSAQRPRFSIDSNKINIELNNGRQQIVTQDIIVQNIIDSVSEIILMFQQKLEIDFQEKYDIFVIQRFMVQKIEQQTIYCQKQLIRFLFKEMTILLKNQYFSEANKFLKKHLNICKKYIKSGGKENDFNQTIKMPEIREFITQYVYSKAKICGKLGKYNKSLNLIRELGILKLNHKNDEEYLQFYLSCEQALKKFKYKEKMLMSFTPQQVSSQFRDLILNFEKSEQNQMDQKNKGYIDSLKEKMFFKYAHQLDTHFYKVGQFDEFFKIQKYYMKSIQYGNKYLFQSLPRLIKLYCDQSDEIIKIQNNQKIIDAFNVNLKVFQEFINKVQPYKLTICIQQLMSRILTPYKQLQDIIIRALALIAFKFYRQAAWWLLSIKYYDKQKKERQEVYDQILRQIKEQQENEGNQQPLIYLRHVEIFYKKLIQVSDLRPEQQRQDRQTLTKIMDKQYLQKVEQQNIILPINDYVMPYINPKINFDNDYNPYKQNYGYIISIDPNYTIISSLQQPKKITLKYKIKGGGNNEERKHFLLKNEKDSDVRTESRTTEFISVLNQFLQTSNFCNRRNINMQNYCIIPLCKEMSLIEWVDNTKTIKDIFDKEGSKKRGFQTSAILNQKNSKLGNIGRQYNEYQWKMLTHQEEVISNYFYSHFDTVDQQLKAIERYTKTLAICTAFVYIIGLGDRHASNILLCEDTGDVFNIDFQCIFEKGKKLAVPELLPFRLTKNVEGPLGAFKSYGLFRLYLINILEFFKKKEKNIMGALDSFLSDPIYTGKQHENSVLHYTQFLTQARNRLTFKQFSTVQQGVDLLIEYAKDESLLKGMFVGWLGFI